MFNDCVPLFFNSAAQPILVTLVHKGASEAPYYLRNGHEFFNAVFTKR